MVGKWGVKVFVPPSPAKHREQYNLAQLTGGWWTEQVMESSETNSSIFLCQSARQCTSDHHYEERDGCQPEVLRETATRVLAVLNIFLVILIGGQISSILSRCLVSIVAV